MFLTCYSFASGNKEKFELGSAIYRDLKGTGFDTGQHYHTGIFQYFEYQSDGYGKIRWSQMAGDLQNYFTWQQDSENYTENLYVGINTLNLNELKNDFKYNFNLREHMMTYHRAYSVNNITPATRASIASTANNIGDNNDILYAFTLMLDVNNVWCWDHYWWCEHWNGQIYRIDELRCDGIVEYSYEKNDIIVSKIFYGDGSINTQRQNIATPDQENVNYHNTLH